MKKIAIIGAGWSGIGCLKVLSEKGYDIDLFEQRDDLGGTWHPDNCYSGLSLHTPAIELEYSDFPLPDIIDLGKKVTSPQIFEYIKEYCQHFGLYKKMKFNMRIEKISYDTQTKKHTLSCVDKELNKSLYDNYDYVIYTNGYSDKVIPEFKGKELFTGSIYHTLDMNEDLIKKIILEKKRIAIVGGSKSATDMILRCHDYGVNVTWLCRSSYWFLEYGFYQKLRGDSHFLNFKKPIYILGGAFSSRFPRIVFYLFKKLNIIHSYDKKTASFKKFHGGIIDEFQMKILKNYYDKSAVPSEINEIKENVIYLKNGKQVSSDVIIFCTGSSGSHSLVDIEIDGKPFPLSRVNKVYRSKVIPDLPGVLFTAYSFFSSGTVNGLLKGKWIEKYISLNLSSSYLSKHSKNYSFPFFLNQYLFDSNRTVTQSHEALYGEYFENGELSKLKLLRWVFSNFYSKNKIVPFEFNPPKDK